MNWFNGAGRLMEPRAKQRPANHVSPHESRLIQQEKEKAFKVRWRPLLFVQTTQLTYSWIKFVQNQSQDILPNLSCFCRSDLRDEPGYWFLATSAYTQVNRFGCIMNNAQTTMPRTECWDEWVQLSMCMCSGCWRSLAKGLRVHPAVIAIRDGCLPMSDQHAQ